MALLVFKWISNYFYYKEIMEIALEQAKEGRIHILNEMSKAITSSREVLADTAPKISTLKIKLEKLRCYWSRWKSYKRNM